jgi:Tol biopolymer transport system component
MKKLTILLAAASLLTAVGCGDSSLHVFPTYITRDSASNNNASASLLNFTSNKSTALAISIPAGVNYISLNNDATQVAYCKITAGVWDIYLMGKDGVEKRLTTNADACQPAFSSDSRTIIAVSPFSTVPHSVVAIPLSTGTPQTLLTSSTVSYWNPSLSPDGKSVLFFLGDPQSSPNTGLYKMAATGTSPTLLLGQLQTWAPAAFSADGKTIFFTFKDSSNILQINSIQLDGTGVKKITTSTGDSMCPRVFGNKILYTVYNSQFNVYSMDPSGANPTLVSSAPTLASLTDDRCWEQY